VKILKSELELSEHEANLLTALSHPNIVRCFGSSLQSGELWILMEYCSLGSLRDLMDISCRALTEHQIAWICHETLKGLIYLHTLQILHRDLKSANILLNMEGEVKIADFGVSEKLQSASKSDEVIGTPHWMAPEVVTAARYHPKCDIWSLGITIIELAEGAPPHHDLSPMAVLGGLSARPSPTLRNPSHWSPNFLDIVAKCLTKDPDLRPSAMSLFQSHPFVQTPPEGDNRYSLKERIRECVMMREQMSREETYQAQPTEIIDYSAATGYEEDDDPNAV